MVGNLVTFVIPVASYHLHLVDRAIESVERQTVPSDHVMILDADNKGTGWARNKGLANVVSPFCCFLDSDDTLEPDYVEKMLAHYRQGAYVYCDDVQGDKRHSTPDSEAYTLALSWHTVTALIPTAMAKFVGGFDVTLPALEDKDFYLKLQAHGMCGIRCPYPLVNYTDDGLRSKLFSVNPNRDSIRKVINERWLTGARKMCCGNPSDIQANQVPEGKQDGDVLVKAQYTPRPMQGRATGRMYPKPYGFNGYQLWVSEADIAASPKDFTRVQQPVNPMQLSPSVEEIQRLYGNAV